MGLTRLFPSILVSEAANSSVLAASTFKTHSSEELQRKRGREALWGTVLGARGLFPSVSVYAAHICMHAVHAWSTAHSGDYLLFLQPRSLVAPAGLAGGDRQALVGPLTPGLQCWSVACLCLCF